MGREIKRVPVDWDWPVNEVWGGYKNPFYKLACKCPDCDGSGSSPEAKRLHDQWYGYAPFKPEDRGSVPFLPSHKTVIALAERNCKGSPDFYGNGEYAISQEAKRLCDLWNKSWSHHLSQGDVDALLAADRLWDFTRTPRTDEQKELVKKRLATGKHNSWLPTNNGYKPTAAEVNEWSLCGFGHDSCNAWIVIGAECKRLGYETTCKRCKGEGSIWPTPELKKRCEKWKNIEPPKGRGWQLWETVSEGSPISPVFKTPEELADWLTESSDYKWRSNDEGTSREQWLKFIVGPGWCPSMIMDGGGVKTGVQAVA